MNVECNVFKFSVAVFVVVIVAESSSVPIVVLRALVVG